METLNHQIAFRGFTQRYIFPFPVKLNSDRAEIFPFCYGNQTEFCLVPYQKEKKGHHGHTIFNVKESGNTIFLYFLILFSILN